MDRGCRLQPLLTSWIFERVSFTDATITPGVTTAKAAHVTELRSNLDTARFHLGLAAQQYTDLSIVAGSTLIKAQHVLDLRSGVQ